MRFPARYRIETTEFFEPFIAEVNGDGKEDIVFEQQLFVGPTNVAKARGRYQYFVCFAHSNQVETNCGWRMVTFSATPQ